MSDVVEDDGRPRCDWAATQSALYRDYHDQEWGRQLRGGAALFERMSLEAFQSGLSWLIILRKRDNFRAAFDGFDIETVARYTDRDVTRLMADVGIVRNRAKIEASIISARAWLKIQEGPGFSNYLWGFVDGAPIQNAFRHSSEIPCQTELSVRLSKDLKGRGFNFCGPTIVYAFCQATGMVNDHLVSCWRHSECAALAKPA